MMIEDQVKLRNGQPLTLNSRMADIIPGWNMTDPNGTENATLLDLMCECWILCRDYVN